jgi:hypothetical protein
MQSRVDRLVVSILLSLAPLFYPTLAGAQAGQASIVGQVNDKSRAALVGAGIGLVSSSTGLTRTVHTDNVGSSGCRGKTSPGGAPQDSSPPPPVLEKRMAGCDA